MEVKKQYQIKISNRFTALKNLDDNVNINMALETIRGNKKYPAKEILGQYELQQYEPWFDEDYSKLLDKRKHVKLK